MATNGLDPILDIVPSDLHQRTPLVVGSTFEARRLTAMVAQDQRPAAAGRLGSEP